MQKAHDPLVDPDIQQSLFEINSRITAPMVDRYTWDPEVYTDRFTRWLQENTNHKIHGLETFPYRAYCSGVTDALQNFVIRHNRRRIRFSQAEFIAPKVTANYCTVPWAWLENGNIEPGDAVIISWPFAGDGGTLHDLDGLLDRCERLGVPVLIDLAYFGISQGLQFDVSRPCITDVTTSLSKPFSVPLRAGIRYSRQYHDDNIQTMNDVKIYNRLAVKVALELMDLYSHQWIVDRYLPRQLKICQRAGLTPTPTLTLALGTAVHHHDFYRQGYYRICITDDLLKNVQ